MLYLQACLPHICTPHQGPLSEIDFYMTFTFMLYLPAPHPYTPSGSPIWHWPLYDLHLDLTLTFIWPSPWCCISQSSCPTSVHPIRVPYLTLTFIWPHLDVVSASLPAPHPYIPSGSPIWHWPLYDLHLDVVSASLPAPHPIRVPYLTLTFKWPSPWCCIC